MEYHSNMKNYHVVKSTKSVGVGILLTLLLGPIGLFYSTIWGGIIMTFFPVLILGIMFLGIGTESEFIMVIGGLVSIGYIFFYWLICMIWSAIAIKQYNKNILDQSNSNISYYPVSTSYESISYPGSENKQITFKETNLYPLENIGEDVPNIQEWLKANPTKGINDYYGKYRK